MTATHWLLAAIACGVLAIFLQGAPEERMVGARTLAPFVAGWALGALIVGAIAGFA